MRQPWKIRLHLEDREEKTLFTLGQFAVQQKLAQHCKLIIILKKKKK